MVCTPPSLAAEPSTSLFFVRGGECPLGNAHDFRSWSVPPSWQLLLTTRDIC